MEPHNKRKGAKLTMLTKKQKSLMRAYDDMGKKTGTQKKVAHDIRAKTRRAIEDLSWLAQNAPKSQFKQMFIEGGLFLELVENVAEGAFRTLPEGEATGFAVRIRHKSDLRNFLPDLSGRQNDKGL